MTGGTGDDLYLIALGETLDSVVEAAGEGHDTVESSALIYTLTANVEDLNLHDLAVTGIGNDLANVITGDALGNFLYGMGGDDTLVGNDGLDTLDGGTGADAMAGGAGSDSYIVDNAGDTVTEGAGGGLLDTVYASVSYTIGANVENLTLTGSANIDGRGNGDNNLITGNSGNNVLEGGAGNDTLNGGGGNDTASYEHATGGVNVDLNNIFAQNTGGAGTDWLISISNLTGSAFNDTLTGSIFSNVLKGLDGNDTLSGGASADRLEGGAGHDGLTGGIGADTFVFASTNATDSDTVSGFQHNTDKVELSAAAFGLAAGPLAANMFVAGAAATEAHGQFVFDASHNLYWDADGTGGGAAVLLASFGSATVSLSDVIVGP
jgi:Ca2+-binding RTX toxin-like protein